jgi:hypothetical protein
MVLYSGRMGALMVTPPITCGFMVCSYEICEKRSGLGSGSVLGGGSGDGGEEWRLHVWAAEMAPLYCLWPLRTRQGPAAAVSGERVSENCNRRARVSRRRVSTHDDRTPRHPPGCKGRLQQLKRMTQCRDLTYLKRVVAERRAERRVGQARLLAIQQDRLPPLRDDRSVPQA